jgi:hypothetical protein
MKPDLGLGGPGFGARNKTLLIPGPLPLVFTREGVVVRACCFAFLGAFVHLLKRVNFVVIEVYLQSV